MRAGTRLLDEARPFLEFAFDEPVILERVRHDFGADAGETLVGFGLGDAFDDRRANRSAPPLRASGLSAVLCVTSFRSE